MALNPDTKDKINKIATGCRNYTAAFALGYFAIATEVGLGSSIMRDSLELSLATLLAQGVKQASKHPPEN